MPYDNVTAIILAGGKGKRMGGLDKGLMLFNNVPMVEHIIQAIKLQCDDIIINANRHMEVYQRYGHPVISDDMSGFQGPLAGFSIALKMAKTPYIITVPCDAPKLAPHYLEKMMDTLLKTDSDIAVVHDGERMQPVYALIKISLAENLLSYLNKSNRKIDLWYAQNKTVKVDFSGYQSYFNNVNTPEQQDQMQLDTQND